MRESRKYLNFLKEYLLLYIIFIIAGIGVSIFLQKQTKVLYSSSQLIEVEDSEYAALPSEKMLLADEAVTMVRRNGLNIFYSSIKQEAVRVGPYAVKISTIDHT